MAPNVRRAAAASAGSATGKARSTKAAVARVSRRAVSSITHALSKPTNGALERHSGGMGCPPGRTAKLLVRVVKLDVPDDELPIGRCEGGKGSPVSLLEFVLQELVQG